MRRTVVACACALAVAGAAAPARAQKTFKVTVASTPAGAEVRLDDRASDPVGTTPWTGSLTEGSHMIILALADHHELVEELVVAAQKKPQKFAFTLQAIQYGQVEVVAGPEGSAGAEVLVDGESKGEVPASLRLEVGPHQVEIVKRGFKRFERWIEVASGEPQEVVAALVPTAVAEPRPVRRPAGARVAPRVVAGAGIELGWRSFRYVDPMTASARPFDATAVPLLHVDIEAGVGLQRLRAGVALEAALGFPPAAETSAGDTIDTSWSELGLEARVWYRLGTAIDVGAELGFGRTSFEFANAGVFADEVPVADYRFASSALGAGARRGKLSGRIRGGLLLPISIGPLAERFRDASALGWDAGAALAYRFRPRLDASLTLAYRRWAMEFVSEPGDAVVASGGRDQYVGLMLGAVYLH